MALSDAFYNEIAEELVAVFSELGTTYTVRTPGAYDEDTLETAAPSTRTVVGLVADQQTALQLTGEGGTWVATKTLILRNDAIPLPSEEIQVDGVWFPLSKVVPIKPAEIAVVYLLDVTR